MRRRSSTKSSKNSRKAKKGKNSQARGRGPTPPRTPAGFPPGAFGPTGLPPSLPPGMELPDISKLKLPPN